MTSRGTTLQIRKSSNPFMTTTASLVGLPLNKKTEYRAPEVDYSDPSRPAPPQTKGVVEYMYQTSSTVVGEGIARGDSRLSQQMDKVTVKKEVRDANPAEVKHVKVIAPQDMHLQPNDFKIQPVDLTPLSKARKEHPMYSTTNREIGVEKSEVQVDQERRGIPNAFTNSFGGIKYRDFGLNTSISRSRVCQDLDN